MASIGVYPRRASPVVGPAVGVVTQLHHRHDVQHPVDAPVAGAGESVAVLVAGGRVQRRGAVPRREVVTAGKPADVTDVAEQTGRSGRADPVEPLQPAAGSQDEFAQRRVRLLDLSVDHGKFGDQIRRQLAAGAPTRSRGRTVANSVRACGADKCFFAPPGTRSSSRACSRLTASVRAWPARRDGPPAAATPPWRRRRRPDEVPWSVTRPPPPSRHRPGRSCGPARWRTPVPARTAWPARRARSRRRRPGAGPPAFDS
jgi:hypothetical protein